MLILVVQNSRSSFDFPKGNYRLREVGSDQALETALELRPDLIVCAPDLLEPLRRECPLQATPILVVTSRSEPQQRVQLLQNGATDILHPGQQDEMRLRTEAKLRDLIQMRRLKEEIVAANRELEGLSYAVSHDLRAPLRAVHGFSAVLMSDYDEVLPPEGKRLLERVHANAARLSQMVDDLLELSRLARQSFHPVQLDLTRMLQQLVEQRQLSRQLDVTIGEGLTALADRAQIQLLWESLLDNAWKFTASKPEAKVVIGKVDGAFFIRDNGVGYDMRYAERLFSPFQRLHGREFEGRGIGLAQAARIAARHGGKIWAEAAVDAGATFFVSL